MGKSSKLLTSALGLMATAALAPAAWAQAAPDTSSSEEEIVVTARAFSERLQDVPVSVTVLTAEQIQNQGITSMADILATAPNVNFNHAFGLGGSFFSLRGQTQERYAEPPIAIVVDGVLEMSPQQFNADDFLMQQVEVLRGPQGALYGVNAIAGALNVTTIRPGDDPEARLTARYGSGNDATLQGYGVAPLVPGVLSALVGFNVESRDGEVRNVTNGTLVDHYDDATGRLRVLFTPSRNLEFDLKYRYSDTDGNDPNLIISSTTGDASQNDDPPSLDTIGENTRTISDVSLRSAWNTGPMGELTVTLDYFDVDEFFLQDFDYTPVPFAFANQDQNDFGFSQDVRFSHDGDRLRWLLGFYHNTFKQGRVTRAFGFAPFPLVRTDVAENETWSGYGSVGYDLNDQWTAEFELRYDNREVTSTGSAFPFTPTATRNETFDEWQPKGTLIYHVDDDRSLYVSVGRGFRVGAINPVGHPFGPDVVEPEISTSYEFGWKTSWFDQRLVVNGAIFESDIENAQFRSFDLSVLASVGLNIAKLRARGLELEGTWRATDYLSFNAGFGYTDSEIQDYVVDPLAPALYGDITGNSLRRVPKYSGNFGFDLTVPVGDGFEMFFRPQYRYTGHYFWDPQNAVERPAENQLNLRAGIARDWWTLTAYGTNVLDERITQDYEPISAQPGSGPFSNDKYSLPPRAEYGVELTLRF